MNVYCHVKFQPFLISDLTFGYSVGSIIRGCVVGKIAHFHALDHKNYNSDEQLHGIN